MQSMYELAQALDAVPLCIKSLRTISCTSLLETESETASSVLLPVGVSYQIQVSAMRLNVSLVLHPRSCSLLTSLFSKGQQRQQSFIHNRDKSKVDVTFAITIGRL